VTLAQGRTRKLRAVFVVAILQRLLANWHVDMLPVDGSLLGVVCVCLLACSTGDANSAYIQYTYGIQYTCSPPLWVLAGYGSDLAGSLLGLVCVCLLAYGTSDANSALILYTACTFTTR